MRAQPWRDRGARGLASSPSVGVFADELNGRTPAEAWEQSAKARGMSHNVLTLPTGATIAIDENTGERFQLVRRVNRDGRDPWYTMRKLTGAPAPGIPED